MNINEAKDFIKASPISTIIGRFMPLNKKGQNHEGLCPFHSDSNPSMKVNDNKGLFKCFVCGVAGDHISFVQKLKNIDFIDSVELIAEHLGLNIDKNDNKQQNPEVELALRVLQAAARVYRKYANDKNIEEFQDFLKQRKLSEQTSKDFQIGYAPKTNLLTSYLESLDSKHKNEAIQMAVKIGLIRKDAKSDGFYDTFRERIIFPIWDHSGQVRGFGSRATKDYQKAKYLNSQESFIFNKRNILYGFNLAKNPMRQSESVILTEGYMDTIALYQNGIEESVALMGIAIGEKPIKIIMSMCKKIYLALDSDNAGFQAMKRINQDFMKEGVLPYFLDFAPYKDPDEYVQNEGQLKFRELLEKAPCFIDVQIEKHLPEEAPELSEQKLENLETIFSFLAPLKTNLNAIERIVNAAKRLKLQASVESITEAYKNSLNNTPQNYQPAPAKKQVIEIENISMQQSYSEEKNPKKKVTSVEKLIIKQIVLYPECLSHQKFSEILDFVSDNEVNKLITRINKLYLEIEETEYVDILQKMILTDNFSLELKEIVSSVLFQFQQSKLNEQKLNKLMSDLLKKIKIEDLKLRRNLIKTRQIQSQTQLESENYLIEIQKIEQQLSDLKRNVLVANS